MDLNVRCRSRGTGNHVKLKTGLCAYLSIAFDEPKSTALLPIYCSYEINIFLFMVGLCSPVFSLATAFYP